MNIDIGNIREEIVILLRNSDIFSVAVRGATTRTDNFTATASQTAFQLTQTPVRNVRSVSVQSVSKKLFTDYTVNYATGVLTLNTGATLSDAVAIQYDYGATSGEKIYPDYPRGDLTLTSFPRIGMEITSARTETFGLSGVNHISDILITIFAFVPVNKDSNVSGGLGGTMDLSDLISTIRNTIRTNAKLFSQFQYIYPTSVSPLMRGTNDKIIHQSADFIAKFLVE